MVLPLPDVMDIASGAGMDQLVGDDGYIAPVTNIYNTSATRTVITIITIAGLPLGLIAVVINTMLIYSIFKSRPGEFRPTYTVYLHIALCDLLNGVVGVITASFMLQNERSPIDPGLADTYCRHFAPFPTCLIRLLVFLMTLLAIFRVHIIYQPTMRLTKTRVYFLISLVYVLCVILRYWLYLTTVQSMALPDGWCIYSTSLEFTPSDRIYYILYALPPLVGSSTIMFCLTVISRKVKKVSQMKGKFRMGESSPLISEPHRVPDRQQMTVAVSIINNILVTFLLCYSAAIYIAVRHLLMAFGILDYHYVIFDGDGPPTFDEFSMVMFRLKFSLTIVYSIINPLLVFRGSSVFRNNIGELFAIDDFSYIVTNRF